MRILHYTLGFPPKRSGGLVEYASSIMIEQSKSGNDVYSLSPGGINILTRKTYIKFELWDEQSWLQQIDECQETIRSEDLVNNERLADFSL